MTVLSAGKQAMNMWKERPKANKNQNVFSMFFNPPTKISHITYKAGQDAKASNNTNISIYEQIQKKYIFNQCLYIAT